MHWAAFYVRTCDAQLRLIAYDVFDVQEVRMRIGSKKIFHLEAWVVKVMSITKHHMLGFAFSDSEE